MICVDGAGIVCPKAEVVVVATATTEIRRLFLLSNVQFRVQAFSLPAQNSSLKAEL